MTPHQDTAPAAEVEQLQHAVDELSFVNEIVTAISSHKRVDRINALVLAKCVRYFDVEQGVIHLVNPSHPEDLVKTAVGLKTKKRIIRDEDALPLRLEIELVGRMTKFREPFLSNDFQNDDRFHGAGETARHIRSVLAVPLLTRDQIIGVLTLFNRYNGRPFTESDQRLLSLIAVPAAQVIESARLYEMEEDVRAARKVQEHLLPKSAPRVNGVDLHGFSMPALQVGGDLFDWVELPGGRVGCVVADVSGKGMPAALLMAQFQGAFRALAHTLEAPDQVLNALARFLRERMELDRFVTLFYAVIDPARNELSYASAGHNPPYVRRADGTMETLGQAGLVLCVVSAGPYEAHRVPFQRGDFMVVYTDGVTEAMDGSGHQWGEACLCDRLQASAFDSARSVADCIHEALSQFTADTDQFDDITLAVVLRK